MVFAEELSARAIVEGVRLGRTVVKLGDPSDPMIEISAAGAGSLEARVTGARGGSVRWVKNGREASAAIIDADPFLFSAATPAPAQGEDRWRAEVSIDGTLRTVTSNMFIAAPVAPTDGGCGCYASQLADRSGWPWSAWLLLALTLTRACASGLRGKPPTASSRGPRRDR